MTGTFFKICFLTLFLFACGEEKKTPEEPKVEVSKLSLKAYSFSELNGWQHDKTSSIRHAFLLSCDKIKNIKKEYIADAAIKIPTKDYQKLCQQAETLPPDRFKSFLEQNFVPYLVTYDGNSEGKFTSYYESSLHASRQHSDKYKYPVYGKPHDLIEFNPADFDKSLPSKRLVGKVKDQKLVPYLTRFEINAQPIDAPVILWTDSYIDLYIMQIQGSAVAYLDDNTQVRIGYADNNGLPFKGIGSILLEKKLIKPGQASMIKIKQWLIDNPKVAYQLMDENHRYIFHRLIDAEGPLGAQGVPLTAGRSLAVDRSFIPLGSLLWLETKLPKEGNISKLMIAQDIGSAIKGAVRGDYFWGSGSDEILDLAGSMNAAGRYYILLPKTMEVPDVQP